MSNDQNSAPEATPVKGELSFNPDEISAAGDVENAAMQAATINYLNGRVTLLRAAVTRLAQENIALRQFLEGEDVAHDDGVEVNGVVQGDRETPAAS